MLAIKYTRSYQGGMRPAVHTPDSILEWEVGHAPPSTTLDNPRIISITATDAELSHIIDTFSGIPWHTKKTTWTGDWARFIFDHLGT